MELVAKIFEILEINGLALVQMGLVVVLAAVLSMTLVKPVLSTFAERESLSTRPLDEAKRFLAEAEAKAREYDDSFRKAAAEVLAGKRSRIEEASRAERKTIEAALKESNREVEAMKGRIAAEKEAAARALRLEVSRLSAEIAAKVLGRPVA